MPLSEFGKLVILGKGGSLSGSGIYPCKSLLTSTQPLIGAKRVEGPDRRCVGQLYGGIRTGRRVVVDYVLTVARLDLSLCIMGYRVGKDTVSVQLLGFSAPLGDTIEAKFFQVRKYLIAQGGNAPNGSSLLYFVVLLVR